MKERRRRTIFVLVLALLGVGWLAVDGMRTAPDSGGATLSNTVTQQEVASENSQEAIVALGQLAIKGRAPKTGYERTLFYDGWPRIGNCDVRNHILARDMSNVSFRSETDCTVLSGVLMDPYTGNTINFLRGAGTSDDVQIDHVVALSDAWQKGAQELLPEEREAFASDFLNLLAVDGPTNQKKGDGDAATWLPPNKDYRCRYIARQIAVKQKYRLWVTEAERNAMQQILGNCPGQLLPIAA